jgi:hypothetical protein
MKTNQTIAGWLMLLAITILNRQFATVSAQSVQGWTTNELPAGLIAWWQAESNMLDAVGSHNGVGDSLPTYASGRFGEAWHFDGVSQSVQIPNVYSDLDGWTQFTLEAWVNFDSFLVTPGGGYSIFSKVGTPTHEFDLNFGYQFGFTLNASQMVCQFNRTGQLWPGYQTLADLHGAVTTNVWVHAAATYDNNAVKLYLNGVPLVTNIIGSVIIAPTSSTLRISKDDNDNVPFPGRIDEARIYNRALSESEIAFLYSGAPKLSVARASPANIMIFWSPPAVGWVLEQTPELPNGAGVWSQIATNLYQTNAAQGWITMTNPINSMFYRLHRP